MENVNGILCIYKPQNMTSFDAVNHVKRTLHVKTGHSGTLDPNAEGVLIVAINKATKALPYLGVEDKVYRATLKLGYTTDTGDIWGETLSKSEVPIIDQSKVIEALDSFVGKMNQRVPMVSAKKINGKKLYEYHRQNIEVKTQYTDIEIYSLDCLNVSEDEIEFRAHVSSGTYIRTLCEDIAEKLQCEGTMSALVRERVGSFSIEDCIQLDQLDQVKTKIIPTKNAIVLPHVDAREYQTLILHGKLVPIASEEPLILMDAGDIYAVGARQENGLYKVQRGLW